MANERATLEARVAALEADNAKLEARAARLAEQRDHYRWLTEHTTDLISRHARDGTFLYASPAARELIGYAPESLIGVSAYDLFHPDDLADLLAKSPRVYHRDGFYRLCYRFRARDGHYMWIETTSRTRRDPVSGELLDILCVSRDVTLRRRAEAQAHRHQEQIAHANRLAATGELASTIAHELNQPLATIANYASGALMRLETSPDAPARSLTLPLTRIHEQVGDLAERLRLIRTFVRRGETRCAPLAFATAVDGAVRLCDWQFRQAGVRLTLDLPDDLPKVHGDPLALEQVLVNLLRNALDASRECPRAERVTISARGQGPRELIFQVHDQGAGVSEAAQERLFTPFHTTRDDGLGMGLAIARSLMEAMGGGLVLAGTGDDGTLFQGTLRLAAPD
ncbi:sensor histidine kinase [Halomonas organivorans]|uniref:histidine kinase n=1 Tax=Halomonas organivorans TaxID=257772 RepID=A0A7W5BY54_9GAMM|nr:ATP-binding protein [Halomonas organivorans]MBB3141269.1 PAS domain S-box-containing protein [Halomonas organivorans]